MKSSTRLAIALLALGPAPAFAAPALEAWNCRFPSGVQHWEVEGDMLVTQAAGLAPGMTRIPIVKNTDDALVAMTDEYAGRRFELVMIDRLKLGIKIVTVGLDGDNQDRLNGICSNSFARPVQPRRKSGGLLSGFFGSTEPPIVRPRVQKLMQEAQNLAAQGFYRPALNKVREADDFDHKTPQEDQMIDQMRQWIAARSGGKRQ